MLDRWGLETLVYKMVVVSMSMEEITPRERENPILETPVLKRGAEKKRQ